MNAEADVLERRNDVEVKSEGTLLEVKKALQEKMSRALLVNAASPKARMLRQFKG